MRCVARSSGRSFLIPAIILLTALAASHAPASAQAYWFETYDRAVALIDSGQAAEASKLLEGLIREHPLPMACARVPGDRCIDYLPYYQRARIQLMAGNVSGAAHSLDVSMAFGASMSTRRSVAACQTLREQIRVRTAELARQNPQVAPTATAK